MREGREPSRVSLRRQYWLWVARGEYYLDASGDDAIEGAVAKGEPDDWWTCHKETKRGDLILLWRTSPKSDLAYLLEATSDAYPVSRAADEVEPGWDYACDYAPVYKFRYPVPLAALRSDPYLQDWSAMRGNFQGRVYSIPASHWKRLTDIISSRNPEFRERLKSRDENFLYRRILLEEEVEDALTADLGRLRRFGYDVELYVDPKTAVRGRQFVCAGNRGRIDLLCVDRERTYFLVIELKVTRATDRTLGQIQTYMGWVQKRLSGGLPVKGLVISNGTDARFADAVGVVPNVRQLDLDALDLGAGRAEVKDEKQSTDQRESETNLVAYASVAKAAGVLFEEIAEMAELAGLSYSDANQILAEEDRKVIDQAEFDARYETLSQLDKVRLLVGLFATYVEAATDSDCATELARFAGAREEELETVAKQALPVKSEGAVER